jgi:protocatechuate 3,4-dioxygenase beta subunit
MLAAILMAALGFAQAAASYRIAGRVVNAVTGEPVRRASVGAMSEEDNHLVTSAVSDAEGNFSITGLAAGKYPLTASRRGFRTAFYDEHDDFNSAIVTGPGQDTEHLVFKLQPGAVLYGTVAGDSGDPVQNASVMLFRHNSAAPGRAPIRAESANTDDTGAYEFSNLAPGEYFLAVKGEPWYAIPAMAAASAGSGENSLDVAYPVTYFDSTTDEASAAPIDLAPGIRTEANISLHAVPAVHLRLSMPQRQGNNFPNPELMQSIFGASMPAGGSNLIVRGPEGVAEFSGVAPGHYELTRNDPPSTVSVDASASGEIDPGPGTPSPPVEGTVRMIDGSPAGELNLVLSSPQGFHSAMQVTAHNGQFHFDGVPPGEWTLGAYSRAGGFQTLFVASMVVSGGSAAGSQLTVRDRPVSVALTLSRTQARVEGFARKDGKPAPGAMIVLVATGPTARDQASYMALVRRDQSDSDGSFSLRDIAPGRYIVVAIADGWKLDWQDRNVIARYLPGGEPVTVSTQSGKVIPLPQPVEAVSP